MVIFGESDTVIKLNNIAWRFRIPEDIALNVSFVLKNQCN